jgi:hypothetical protein
MPLDVSEGLSERTIAKEARGKLDVSSHKSLNMDVCRFLSSRRELLRIGIINLLGQILL